LDFLWVGILAEAGLIYLDTDEIEEIQTDSPIEEVTTEGAASNMEDVD
jgi:hypothetical protein